LSERLTVEAAKAQQPGSRTPMPVNRMDPVRREELRIMGYSDVIVLDPTELPNELMAKTVPYDGPIDVTAGRVDAVAGDVIIENAAGTVEHVTIDEWETLGYVLMPHDETAPGTEPSELAEPVGLLKREEEPSDAD
jgi:hypothetical protein